MILDHWKVKVSDIEKWIVEWYKEEFNEVGDDDEPRAPPIWLANWRDKNG